MKEKVEKLVYQIIENPTSGLDEKAKLSKYCKENDFKWKDRQKIKDYIYSNLPILNGLMKKYTWYPKRIIRQMISKRGKRLHETYFDFMVRCKTKEFNKSQQ